MIDDFIRELEKVPDNKLQVLIANLDKAIIVAQKKYEEAIETYGVASDFLGDATMAYRNRLSEATQGLRSDPDHKVTTIPDLARGLASKEKSEMIKAEGKVKQCAMWVSAFESRVNALKYIGRKSEPLSGSGPYGKFNAV